MQQDSSVGVGPAEEEIDTALSGHVTDNQVTESEFSGEPESTVGAEDIAPESNGAHAHDGADNVMDANAEDETDLEAGLEPEVTAGAEAEPNDPFALVHERLRGPLQRRGFESLTEVQSAILDADQEGRDLQVSSQTGSGKTVGLGFVLVEAAIRAMENPSHTGPSVGALVITPTRELANQVSDELVWLYEDLGNMRTASVTGGTPMFRDRQTLGRRPHLLVGTPGRLLDHVRSGNLDLSGVREVVLDEADQMLDMGFREDLEAILDATHEERRMHLVSATFPQAIQRLAGRYQNNPLFVEGTPLGDANADIEHIGHLVRGQDRYAALVNHLLLADGARALVFVERRADTMALATQLEADGFAALPISGDLAQSQRERALNAFREGKATILVATDVAARGLDVPDVHMVVQTSPPIDPATYTHRSGRTGRAGKQGLCLLFSPPHRRRYVDRLLADANVQVDWRPVPSAGEVSEAVAVKTRVVVEEQIKTALERDPGDSRREFAKTLLESHDSVDLVAALLIGMEPKRKAQAQDVNAGGGQGDRGGNSFHSPRGAARGQRDSGAPHGGGGVRFFISYGANQGANPSRVLAAVCRRGAVDGASIGSISVHPNATTFDVEPAVAESFEQNAGQRDPRDADVVIRRDRGPAGPGGPGGGRRRGGGFRRGRSRGYGARRR